MSLYMFEFVRSEPSGRRRHIDSAPHQLGTLREAKMLAAAMLKHTTFLGMSADIVLIKSEAGELLSEVVAEPRTL